MFTYAYQARDNSGKISAGVQDAINEENAINSLMSRGLMVLTITQKSAAGKTQEDRRGQGNRPRAFHPANWRRWSMPASRSLAD